MSLSTYMLIIINIINGCRRQICGEVSKPHSKDMVFRLPSKVIACAMVKVSGAILFACFHAR